MTECKYKNYLFVNRINPFLFHCSIFQPKRFPFHSIQNEYQNHRHLLQQQKKQLFVIVSPTLYDFFFDPSSPFRCQQRSHRPNNTKVYFRSLHCSLKLSLSFSSIQLYSISKAIFFANSRPCLSLKKPNVISIPALTPDEV